jgi:hypothetical protein
VRGSPSEHKTRAIEDYNNVKNKNDNKSNKNKTWQDRRKANHIRGDKETTRQDNDRSETTLVKTGEELRGNHARCKVTPDQRNRRVHRGEEQEARTRTRTRTTRTRLDKMRQNKTRQDT